MEQVELNEAFIEITPTKQLASITDFTPERLKLRNIPIANEVASLRML
ncbi:MAG: hypothetical protein K0U37_01215 [Gammaproteobacteria bacterium]|nr:hypothetical protein [Gammaproteobacteria bacterium]